MDWLYRGGKIKDINDTNVNGWFGFIYKITHIPTGKVYFGRKNFFTNRNIKLGKKELAIIREERKTKKMKGRAPSKKLVVKESDWLTYWGSNKSLISFIKKEGVENFRREILEFARDKKHLTYLETELLFKNEVLLHPDKYFNDNILGKFFTKDFEGPDILE